MSMNDIKAAIMKKQKNKTSSGLMLSDVNRQLIIALTALPVYGKEVRDEEILSLIINGGKEEPTYLDQMRDEFKRRVDNKEIKKVKGEYRDRDGFLVLEPRI